MKLPAKLNAITVLVDTREQRPFSFPGWTVKTETLTTGDYSVWGLRDTIAVERKSLSDLVACVGRGRSRFEKKLDRLRAFPARAVVVEAGWAELERGGWQGTVTPRAVTESVLAWIGSGIPFVLAGSRSQAAEATRRFLLLAANRMWTCLRSLAWVERKKSGDDQPLTITANRQFGPAVECAGTASIVSCG